MRKILSFILTLVACLGLGGLVYSNTVNAAAVTETFQFVKGESPAQVGATPTDYNVPGKFHITATNGTSYSNSFKSEQWRIYAGANFKFEWTSSAKLTSLKFKFSKDGFPFKSNEEIISKFDTATNTYKPEKALKGQVRLDSVTYSYEEITGPTVKFMLNDGTDAVFETLPANGAIAFPQDPVREGYEFLGWFDASTGGNKVTELTTTENKALYANWLQKEKISVTFDYNDEVTTSTIVEGYKGDTVLFPQDPLREGFKFIGWFDQKVDGQKVDTLIFEAPKTLYAHWEVSEFSTVIVNKDTFKASQSGSGYAAYNGLHQIGAVTLESKSVMLNGTNLQIKKSEGFLTNAKPLGKIESVTFKGQSDSDAKILFSQTPIDYKTAVEKGNVVLAGTDTYAAGENDRYFMIVATATFTASDIIINYVPATVKDYFEAAETKSSLKITYALDTKEPTDVDLRFGGMISADAFDSTAEYGVIVVPTTEDLTNVTPEKLAELKTKNMVMTCTPARVDEKGIASETGSYYQFAWVITNMEGHYDYAFNSVMYMVKDGKVYLSQVNKNDSVQTVAKRYVDNSVKLGLTEEQVQVLNKLLPQA